MNVKPGILILAASCFIYTPCFADFTGKAFTDQEIRNLIIEGAKAEFDRGQCYAPTRVEPEATQQPSIAEGSITGTENRTLIANIWGDTQYNIQSTQQKQKPLAKPRIAFRCVCACPDSKNEKGEKCGINSAYFQYPEQYKPKCYPEDVKDWEVTDFRLNHEIRSPDKTP